eukprot:CAMPEP_0184015456 /NCGR_PEP_ID=MMETSP0954-20121128/6316_1 /TAXON_ID=627963 /ORGANISM="Aplanochytrium sp, Strain PBS07" /LENGTH=222 /DNA_ID=CAMNT_0026296233 /DNA_START=3 /DNA_END=671 /DNA_ORIENTATION=+
MNPPCADLPSLDHLTQQDYMHVYEPSDDTYLFVDTLESEKEYINSKNPRVCAEIGGGSGCLSAALSRVLKEPAAFFISDINPFAAQACLKTLKANKVAYGEVLNADFLNCISSRLERFGIDILLFNPPYVVTPSEEIGTSNIAASWAGGVNGREVLDRLIPKLPGIMSNTGTFYVVAIEENNPDNICQMLLEVGFNQAKVISRRKAYNEKLMIIRADMIKQN